MNRTVDQLDNDSSQDDDDDEEERSEESDGNDSSQHSDGTSSSSSSHSFRIGSRFGLLHRRNNDNLEHDRLGHSDSSSSQRSRNRRFTKKNSSLSNGKYRTLCLRILSNIIRDIASSKKTSLCFLISILFWLSVEIYFSDIHLLFSHYKHSPYTSPRLGVLEQAELLRARREQDALSALGPHGRYHRESSASWDSQDVSSTRVDRIPKSCSYISWHTLAFPNCNDIHEIDLTQALNIRRNGPMIPVFLGDDQAIAPDASIEEDWTMAQKMGYMGSGLWRQVWKVNPRYETNETLIYAQTSSNQSDYDPMYAPAVLKMMKQEQPFHERNFDRHRRDALVMERLTSSPFIPSIYGYCGNTVLTEFFGKSLSDVVFRGASTNTALSPKSSQGRIRLALAVMRGIQALHEIQDGPIVHADIQIDQFLYDDRTHRIILNDFNRCRFLPRRKDTGKVCKVKIPSAPGGHRSPEEYDLMHIDEKVDIFSAGNILHTILTGKIPWENRDRVDIQRNVRMGTIPDVDDEYRDEGSLDAHLLDIIENVFETDPAKRKSARVIVEELEALLERDVKVK